MEVASQWQLMWRKFKRHKVAMIGGVVVLMFYATALLADFVAPTHFTTYNKEYVNAPPQSLRLIRDGKFAPYVVGYQFVRDPKSFKKTWTLDESVVIPVGLLVRGEPYKLLGFIPGDIHLIGPLHPDDPFYLLGTDKGGRDVFGRIVFSSQISLTVGLIGVRSAWCSGS